MAADLAGLPSAKDFFELGLRYAGFNCPPTPDGQDYRELSQYKTLVRQFSSFYQLCHEGCALLFQRLCISDTPGVVRLQRKDQNPLYFLMTIHWLTTYKTEHQLRGVFKIVEKTIRKKLKLFVRCIQSLKIEKIVWLHDAFDVETFILSVDGVHCRIMEPTTDPGTKWYSEKLNGPGLAYELAVALWHNQICWVNGPFPPGSHPDLKIYRSALKEKIPNGKKVIADKGYRGEPSTLSLVNSLDSRALKDLKKRAKARQETVNSRLKRFKILEHAFRHGNENHQSAFEACLVCVQFNLETNDPLFEL